MANRVVHFEIQTSDPDKTIAFYKELFGWDFQKWEGSYPYWLIMTAPKDSKEMGINGGMLLRPGNVSPSDTQFVNAYVCTVGVESVDATLEKAVKLGGTVAMPKYAIAGMAWQAYCKDPEGNLFGIHQPDPTAK